MENIFLIRSSDRTSNSTSSTAFTLQLSNTIEGEYEIEYINMYNTFYTVVTGFNDKLYWNDGSTNHTTTVPPGIYSSSGSNSIATQMTAASSASATITAAFDAYNQKLTITSTQNFSLKFGTNTTNSIAKTLGYTNADTTAATIATATYLPSLSGPSSVNIRIAECDIVSWNNGLGQYGSVLLPMNVSANALKEYTKDDFRQFVGFRTPVQQLNISVFDTTGNALSLNGTDWELAMRKIRPRYN